MRPVPVLVLVLVLFGTGAQAQTITKTVETSAEETAPRVIQPARADYELVDSLTRTSSVRTNPPQPSPSQYFRDLMASLLDWLSAKLDLSSEVVEILAQIITWIGVLLLGTTLGALLVLLLRIWRRRVHARQPAADGQLTGLARETSAVRSPEQYWQELEQALARQRISEALAALWWWLARSLTGADAEVSWTTRELLAHRPWPAQPELVRLCRRLDGLIYGRRQVPVQAVRELAQRLRSTLS